MKKTCLLPLSLLLLACRPVGTDYARPAQALPAAFTAPGGGAALAPEWWKALGDARLDRLVRRALERSPDLRAAEARMRQARALQRVQEGAGGPDLALNAAVTRDRLSQNGEQLSFLPNRNMNTNFTNHQVGFDASWELDFFGRDRRLAEGARARAEAGAERARGASVILSAEVAREYVDLRAVQERLRVAQEALAAHAETVRLTALSARAGESAQLEVQRAEAARGAFEATLADLRLEQRQHLATLGALTDTPLADLEPELGAAAPLMAVPEAPAAGLPSDLLERRPDVRSAEHDLAAASADVAVAQAERLPRFSLLGSAGWNSTRQGNLLDQASRAWSVGPHLSLPLLNQGRLKSQVEASAAARDAAAAGYRKAVLEALADVEVALARMSRAEERRLRQEESLDHQARLLRLTERQQEAGEVSRLTVLDARRGLLLQQDQALRARAQSLEALIALSKALGGGWQTAPI